jgi:hypothetical protein
MEVCASKMEDSFGHMDDPFWQMNGYGSRPTASFGLMKDSLSKMSVSSSLMSHFAAQRSNSFCQRNHVFSRGAR